MFRLGGRRAGGFVAGFSRGAVYLNLLLLMTIAFLPYPTGVLGEALARHRGEETAAVFYAVTTALNAYAWVGLWLYASHRRRLLNQTLPEEERRVATLLFAFGGVAYTVAVGIAVLNAYAFLALQAVVAGYYTLDPLSRRATRAWARARAVGTPSGHETSGHQPSAHEPAALGPPRHKPSESSQPADGSSGSGSLRRDP